MLKNCKSQYKKLRQSKSIQHHFKGMENPFNLGGLTQLIYSSYINEKKF